MAKDPIVDEVRAVRDEFAKRHNYDVDAIVRGLQEASERAGREMVTLPPRKVGEDSRGKAS